MGYLSNNNNQPYGDNNPNAMCVLRRTGEGEVAKVLRSCEGNRYHRDEIQPSILVKVSDVTSPISSNIFNKCILRVVPIFKSGYSNMAPNYRPISPLSVFNKYTREAYSVEIVCISSNQQCYL